MTFGWGSKQKNGIKEKSKGTLEQIYDRTEGTCQKGKKRHMKKEPGDAQRIRGGKGS